MHSECMSELSNTLLAYYSVLRSIKLQTELGFSLSIPSTHSEHTKTGYLDGQNAQCGIHILR